MGPQDLGNPIPGSQGQASAQSAQSGLGGTSLPGPVQSPQPQESLPQQSAAQQRSPAEAKAGPDDIAKDFNSGSESADSLQKNNPVNDPTATHADTSFDGKLVEGNFLGAKARVTAEGIPQIWSPRFNKWEDATDTGGVWKQMAKGIYSAVESIPETAASVGASMIPGEGLASGLIRPAVAGAAAYAGRASGLSEGLVNALYNPKNLYILKKIAGVEGEPSPTASALLTAGGQGVGEILGAHGQNAAASTSEKAQTDQSVYNILQQGKPLEKAAQEAGIPLRGTQIAANLPGGGDAAALEQGMASGKYGPVNQAQVQLANQNQAQAIGNAVDRLVNRVAPNVDFDNLDINRISGTGGQKLNFLDRIQQSMQQNLSTNRAAVSEMARDRQFDASQVIAPFETQIKQLLPYAKGLVNTDGSVNMERFVDVAKQEGYSDKALNSFAQAYVTVKNAVSRQAEGLSKNLETQTPSDIFPGSPSDAGSQLQTQMPLTQGSSGAPQNIRQETPPNALRSIQDIKSTPQSGPMSAVGGQPESFATQNNQPNLPGTSVQTSSSEGLLPRGEAGEAQAGLTFKQISALTDRIQDLAYSNGKDTQFTRALKNVAQSSKGLEDDITSQIFKENGNDAMAQRVINQKETYAGVIDDLRNVSNLVAQNPDNAARIIFNAPATTIKKILPALSDQHKSEIAGSLLVNSAYEDISKIPVTNMISSVNADSIQKQFFGSLQSREKSDIIFGDAAPDLEKILSVARMAQSVSGPTAEDAGVKGAASIVKMIPKMFTKGVPLDKLGVLLNSVFSDNPTAKDIINTNLSDMIVRQEKALASSSSKASSSASVSKVVNNPAFKPAAAGGANFLKNLMM